MGNRFVQLRELSLEALIFGQLRIALGSGQGGEAFGADGHRPKLRAGQQFRAQEGVPFARLQLGDRESTSHQGGKEEKQPSGVPAPGGRPLAGGFTSPRGPPAGPDQDSRVADRLGPQQQGQPAAAQPPTPGIPPGQSPGNQHPGQEQAGDAQRAGVYRMGRWPTAEAHQNEKQGPDQSTVEQQKVELAGKRWLKHGASARHFRDPGRQRDSRGVGHIRNLRHRLL